MAEGLLKKALPGHEISSAGVLATPGAAASVNAVAAAGEKGFDISSHAARRVTKELILANDLILCMTERHKDMLENENCYTLGEYAGNGDEIDDPFGGDIQRYRQCIRHMELLIKRIAEKISNDDSSV